MAPLVANAETIILVMSVSSEMNAESIFGLQNIFGASSRLLYGIYVIFLCVHPVLRHWSFSSTVAQ